MAKRSASAVVISPSLLANIPKRPRECHEQFRLGMGEWTESSEESSTENEAAAPKAPKKLRLSLQKRHKQVAEKDKENRWQFVDEAEEAALGKSLYRRIPLQARNGPCRTSLLGEIAEMRDILNPRSRSPSIFCRVPILQSLASAKFLCS